MRIVIGIRMRIRPPKRRTPMQRLHARLYYRQNKAKIRVQRRKYLRKYKSVLQKRKLFKRFKPKWFKHTPKPKMPKLDFKVKAPKYFKTKHAPKVKHIVPRRPSVHPVRHRK